jgi:hypothetical protein
MIPPQEADGFNDPFENQPNSSLIEPSDQIALIKPKIEEEKEQLPPNLPQIQNLHLSPMPTVPPATELL